MRGLISRAKVPLAVRTGLTEQAAAAVNTKAATIGEEEGPLISYEFFVFFKPYQTLLQFNAVLRLCGGLIGR